MLKVAGERKCREAQACLEGNIFILQDHGQAIYAKIRYSVSSTFATQVVAVGDVRSCCAHKFIS